MSTTRSRISSRPNGKAAACIVEAVDPRMLMAGHFEDVGTLNGRFFEQRSVFGSDKDGYQFEMPRAGKIDVQLSRLIGTGTMTLLDSNGNTIASAGASTKDRHITIS